MFVQRRGKNKLLQNRSTTIETALWHIVLHLFWDSLFLPLLWTNRSELSLFWKFGSKFELQFVHWINIKGFSEKNSTLVQNFLKNEVWSWDLTYVRQITYLKQDYMTKELIKQTSDAVFIQSCSCVSSTHCFYTFEPSRSVKAESNTASFAKNPVQWTLLNNKDYIVSE